MHPRWVQQAFVWTIVNIWKLQFMHPRWVQRNRYVGCRVSTLLQFMHPRWVQLHLFRIQSGKMELQFMHPRWVQQRYVDFFILKLQYVGYIYFFDDITEIFSSIKKRLP